VSTLIAVHARFLGKVLRTSGPYLILELLLPGGTLFALLLFYYQRRTRSGDRLDPAQAMTRFTQMVYRAIVVALYPVVTSAWRGADDDDGMQALAMVPAK